MAFSGNTGMELDLGRLNSKERDDFLLFSESNSRFLVEIPPAKQKSFEKLMRGAPLSRIGRTTKLKQLIVLGTKGDVLVAEQLDRLRNAWKSPLK